MTPAGSVATQIVPAMLGNIYGLPAMQAVNCRDCGDKRSWYEHDARLSVA